MEPFRAPYRTNRYSADGKRRGSRRQAHRKAFGPDLLRRLVEPVRAGPQDLRDDLAEWDYGAYEGITTKEILADRPGWQLFRDGCPNGEFAADVGARADAVIHALREAATTILIFSSSHFLRVLAARWLGLPPEGGVYFSLDTTSISVLGYEHDLTEPVIRRWNQR